ncbi:TetR/AcrR family transcriptional regulator [Streptomyces sp. NPDC054796]
MPRPRNFDEDRAVDAALEAFRATGYEATSTQDLCEATGLGRSSIYNTFRSKHDLFRRTLVRYTERLCAEQRELMAREDLPAREKVRVLLDSARLTAARGCLLVNTAVELADRDEEIARLLREGHERRVAGLRAMFESARRAGEIDGGKDPHGLALFVLATVSGMRVSARSGADESALSAIAETALTAF